MSYFFKIEAEWSSNSFKIDVAKIKNLVNRRFVCTFAPHYGNEDLDTPKLSYS